MQQTAEGLLEPSPAVKTQSSLSGQKRAAPQAVLQTCPAKDRQPPAPRTPTTPAPHHEGLPQESPGPSLSSGALVISKPRNFVDLSVSSSEEEDGGEMGKQHRGRHKARKRGPIDAVHAPAQGQPTGPAVKQEVPPADADAAPPPGPPPQPVPPPQARRQGRTVRPFEGGRDPRLRPPHGRHHLPAPARRAREGLPHAPTPSLPGPWSPSRRARRQDAAHVPVVPLDKHPGESAAARGAISRQCGTYRVSRVLAALRRLRGLGPLYLRGWRDDSQGRQVAMVTTDVGAATAEEPPLG